MNLNLVPLPLFQFMKKLLESLSPAYTVDVNMNLLFCLSKFKNQQFSQ